MKTELRLFEDVQTRRVYDEEAEIWWFSVIDIVQVLTQQTDYQAARNYWKVLKNRLNKEGSQLVTDCNQLKMTATDGKQRITDVATAETLLRVVQPVPSLLPRRPIQPTRRNILATLRTIVTTLL